MRTLVPLMAIAMATACNTGGELRYASTLTSQTRGLALSESGIDAHVGMIGTTCTIDVNWGCPTSDADLPSDEERVLDHHDGVTLGSSPTALHIIRDAAWQSDLDIAMPGVKAAVLRDDGPLMLAGGTECALHIGDTTISAPASACADDAMVSFDREGGSAFVADGQGVIHVSDAGVETLAERGDLVAYDRAASVVYVASTGSHEVQALRTNGAQAWSIATDGPITSLTNRGTHGQLLVMTEVDGFGQLELHDGVTGDMVGAYKVPSAECLLTSSENGGTIACQRGEDINFYELDEGIDGPIIDDTPPENCIDPLSVATAD